MSEDNNQTKQQMLAVVLERTDVKAAEALMMEIADQSGDDALMRIAADIPAVDLAELLLDSDITRPSLLHGLLAPDKFGEVFSRVGAGWKAAVDESCEIRIIHSYQEEMLQFICANVLLTDNLDDRVELLRVILCERLGIEAVVFATIQEKEFFEFMAGDGKVSMNGDWQEVLGIVATHLPDQWTEIKSVIREITDPESYDDFVRQVAAEVYGKAAEAAGVVVEKSIAKDETLFTPLSS